MSDYLGEEKYRLAGSFLEFTKLFYYLRTGRKFRISEPPGRESHFKLLARALTRVLDGHTNRLIINVPPRYGKSEMLIHFAAWAMAIHPDSNFLYVSYSHSLARKQTQTIRSIMQMQQYKDIFGVKLSETSQAKDDFETLSGGSCYATGSGGTITGRGAGIQGAMRFGGAIIIDDIHKPDEVTSDVMRNGVIDWYYNTLQSRLNSPDTPIIFIGQRLHEADLPAHLLEQGDWETVILPAIDEAQNALYPELHSLEDLRKMEKENPYVYSAQYQQSPQPAGGGIFKPEWFYQTDETPNILATFITADTAESSKTYNDATVFSFWGVYLIEEAGHETELLGLHWLDCWEVRVEPKDLENAFRSFYRECMLFQVKPTMAAIEKKSTGVTLLSVLESMRGLELREVSRTRASGNKVARYLEVQPFVASKRISINREAKHKRLVLDHLKRITANDSHRHDDIADTLYDAIKIGLIDNQVKLGDKLEKQQEINKVRLIADRQRKLSYARKQRYGSSQTGY
jgi:predicted phage terminase large subunit-like protein